MKRKVYRTFAACARAAKGEPFMLHIWRFRFILSDVKAPRRTPGRKMR